MATMTSLSSISADSYNPDSATGKPSSRFALSAILPAFVTLLAAFLRMHALTAKSFWLDEGVSIDIARLPWPRFLHVMWSGEANMALYYLVLRFWLIFGSSEGFVRGLSVLFSVATVPVVFFLGARLFSRRVGLLAALLLAINAYHIRYAQETRSYAMVVFVAVLVFAIYVLKTGAPPSLWFTPLQPDSLVLLGIDFSGVYGRLLLSLHVLAMGIAALGAARVRRGGEHTSDAWGYTLLFSWLVAPVVMVVTVSLVKPLFVPRFLSFCLPALLLLVSIGITRL